MSRRSRRKTQISPSLFPFLAVLICTMGAIIVLLVLVVKNADVQASVASEVTEQEREEKRQEWQDRLDLEKDQIDSLKELRPDLKERLEEEKTVVGHLVDHVARLNAELKRLQQTIDQLNVSENSPDSLAKSAEQIEKEINLLNQKLVDAKKELAEKQTELASARPTFSIIPKSQGGNGTFRRPIFVECNEYGVTLQPYGITLGPSDFPRELAADNPLDRALLMIRDYWNQVDPNRKEGQPYPLFVVRPSGSKSFAAARKAMKSWVDEFGYELVTSDIEIKYPDVDEQFKERLSTAVEQARAVQKNRAVAISRQQALNQIRRLESRSRSNQGFRASSVGGGFVRDNSSSSAGRFSGSSFSSTSQSQSIGSPRQDGGSEFASSTRSLGGSGSFGGSNSLGGSGAQSGTSQRPSEQMGNSGTQRNSNFQAGTSGQDSGGRESSFVPKTNGQASKSSSSEGGGGGPNSGPSSGNEGGLPQLPPESLARSRGVDWALPSKSNNAIQVRKPIKIQVNRDSVQIVEIGKGVRTIPFGRTTATAVPGLIELVWKHIDAWGIAGVNSYWKPTLNMYVAPDAHSRFNDLQILLSGSGLDMRRAQR